MILRTKIIPPPLRQPRVDRPRLYTRLDRVLERRLALVSAPAGYGKTSLVRAWLDRLPRADDGDRKMDGATPLSIAWLSLDAGDDDVGRFLTALVAALRAPAAAEDDALGKSVLAMLEQPQRPPTAALVTDLLNELQKATREFIVVLDDFHLLQNKALHEALTLFLEGLPAHVHLVISSRADPPLPLWRLRAADDLVQLRAADLRFSAGETADFLDDVMALALPAQAVSALEAQMEGWIAGLQMAALAARDRQDGDRWEPARWLASAPAAQQSHIFDYLAAEVLDRQPLPVRRFLLATAILDRLCSPLCHALLHDANGVAEQSQGLLRRLVDGNLFLVPLDDEERWFRYHHLFHTFLRRQLAQGQKSETVAPVDALPDVEALHARASAWYAENEDWQEAIKHALAAGDVDGAAVLVGKAINGLFLRGKLVAIRRYLELLPEEALLARHNYCVGYAWVLALGGELGRVEKYLQAAERQLAALAQEEPPPFDVNAQRSNLALIRAIVAQRHGDAATMARLSRRALDTLQEIDAPALRSIAAFTLGEAYSMSGQLREAQQTLQRAVTYGQTAGHRYLSCSALSSLARLRRRQGRLQEAEALYRRILQLAQDENGEGEAAILGSAIVGLGALVYEWNRLPEAHELARRAVALYEASGEAAGLVRAYVLLARVKNAQGEDAEGRAAMQQALSLAQRWQLPAEMAWTTAWRARDMLRGRNRQAAMALVRQAVAELQAAEGDSAALSPTREFVELALARVHLAGARAGVAQAMSILKKWESFAREHGLSALLVETGLLQAQAQRLQGDEAQARRRLAQALMLAQPAGYVRLFVDEGVSLSSSLRELRSDNAIGAYARRLLQAVETSTSAPDLAEAPRQALTDRQREILALLARGLSNREIGERLVISPETVRWHTKQIYRRLDVRNRTEAAAYARQFYSLS